jgi:hypothetical protein
MDIKKVNKVRKVLFLLNSNQMKVHQSKKIFTITLMNSKEEVEVITLNKKDGIWAE